jgi:hypothetical protein
MTPIRYRDESDADSRGALFLAVGALAGLAAGVLIAQRFGGFSGISARVRGRFAKEQLEAGETEDDRAQRLSASEFEGAYAEEEDEAVGDEDSSPDAVLEERVLEAFRNDPILSERAVDIGAVGDGIIELTGWVHADEEAAHAVTLTRGVPGVDTVVNRLAVREEEDQLDENARRFEEGDPALTEARWEGQRVGTGRRRQGTSAENDRHADPKPNLEDRWLSEREAIRAAAEDTENIAERRRKKPLPKGGRTDGSPIAPTGVAKADHVADPDSEEARQVMREQTGRDTLRTE